MVKLARLQALDRSAEADADIRLPRLRTRFYAFLSYSHKDKELADWLHQELERFRVPHSLAGKLTANGVVPRRLTPIFRDQHDLSAGGDLAEEIKAALAASQFLVVLCSPTAAKSRWTNQEIESFKRTRPESCVIAAVASGEPFASDVPGHEDEECFPPALRYKYDRRGHRTGKRADPLAADFRQEGEGKRRAFLKLVAGMLGVGLDELVRREQTRHQRQLAYVAAASLAGMAVTSTLAFSAIQARDTAREQRRAAEGLIGFMLGDLKDKLEPIGKLDALDGVGGRVLAYYRNQPIAQLTDGALSQRSSALTLMAQVAEARGDVPGSLRLYREAMAGTAESMRRDPKNPQALFDHAQNVFYVGQIAHNRGDFRTAEASMREYRRLALRMIALSPDSMKYRMEEQYADTNLGVVLSDQRRFAEAAAQFAEAQTTMEAIATADPKNKDYQKSVAETFAWLGDAKMAMGDLRGALAARQRDVAILERLLAQTGDVDYQQRLLPARRMLGVAYAAQGQTELAAQQFRTAVEEADKLIPKEPNNTNWLEYAFKARLELAKQLISAGDRQQAGELINQACRTVDELLRRDAGKPGWRAGSSRCRALQAQLALAAGDKQQALSLAQQSVAASRTVHSGSPADDSYIVAGAYRLVGDVQRQLGNADAARSAWQAAFSSLPAGRLEQPGEMVERASILRRLGRAGEAQQLVRRLTQMGYHDPEISSV